MNCRPVPPKLTIAGAQPAGNELPEALRARYCLAMDKAIRCFRLARTVNDPAVAQLLQELGEDYMREAERLLLPDA